MFAARIPGVARATTFATVLAVACVAHGRAPDIAAFVLVEDISPSDLDIMRMDANGEDVSNLTRHGALDTHPEWSPNGRQVAFSSNRDGDYNLYLMDADGSNLRRLTDGPDFEQNPTWSPTGREIAYVTVSPGVDGIYVVDVARGAAREVAVQPPGIWALGGAPRWSPDGAEIAFTVQWGGGTDIWVMEADGSNARNLTGNADDPMQEDWLPSWSPDGRRIAFASARDDEPNNMDIYSMGSDGSDTRRLTKGAAADVCPAWAPDGSAIAFISTRNDEPGVYMMRVDGQDQRLLRLFERRVSSIDWFDPATLSIDAVRKRPFTWGWLKRMARR